MQSGRAQARAVDGGGAAGSGLIRMSFLYRVFVSRCMFKLWVQSLKKQENETLDFGSRTHDALGTWLHRT
jgi:hypothetical protein